MKLAGILLLAAVLAGCGAAVGKTGGERLALRIEINEALAVSHLKSLVGAETQAQSLEIVDADEDGIGEFSFLLELAGGRKLHGPGKGLKFPLLPSDFRNVSSLGYVEVQGYLYRDFLPGEDGSAVAGDPGPARVAVSADGAEEAWMCYAWPVGYGTTGKRTFLATSEGVIHAADVATLSGRRAPEAGTALVPGEGFLRAVRAGWKEVD